MEIVFKEEKFRKECNNFNLLQKKHGLNRAKLINRRLNNLRGADTLEVMRNLSGRCHELKGDRSGQISIDLDGPYRLFFQPIKNNSELKKSDGSLDWTKVIGIKVLGVGDPHE